MSPSWVELVGRNAAAESVHLSGTLVVTETPDETVRYDFRHAPGGRWRIDNDGQVIYVAGPARTVARVDDEMRELSDRIRIVMLGTQFTPLDLLGPDSILGKMSHDVRPIGDAQPVEVAGRAAWSVPLAAPGQGTIHVAIDDSTGVVARVSDDHRALLQLERLNDSTPSDDSLFDWDGPVGEPMAGRRRGPTRRPSDLDENIEFMQAIVAAREIVDDVMKAITTADSESAARAALVDLLDVPDEIADAVAAAPLSTFRADIAAGNRRTLRTLQERRSTGL